MRRAAFLLLALSLRAAAAQDPEGLDFFEKRIRPVLAERCYRCHSGEADSIRGGLRLDSREAILRGGSSGPAVLPGDPARSPLIRAIRYADEEIQMPPKTRLKPEEIAAFETWVRLGAPAPADAAPRPARPKIDWAAARAFWSFRPLASASGVSIDDLIEGKLRERGLAPAGPADKGTLLRRATFDLVGLPPTPGEIDGFLADDSPDAFARVVDRLLSSPHYGERWGRHWLDLVRYADTAGDSADYPVPQARKYRDWVIAALNADLPYDRFIREQVAGDLLPDAGRDGIVATGFLAIARRFGEEPAADHALTIDDTIDTLGRAVLGLTLSCARCHDHKFDPITQEDYTAVYGILQSTRYPYAGSDKMKYQKDFVPLVPREEALAALGPFEERLAALDREARPLEEEIARRERELSEGKAEGPPRDPRSLGELRKARGEIQKKREALAKERPAIDDAYAVSEGAPAHARIHVKGNPRHPGDEVPRRWLELLGGAPVGAGSGRRDLAEWLTATPLAARVMANRIWQHHFGRGLVRTPSYFGRQGLAPTHPELLEFLAGRFIESGWSMKAMHRLIMLSRAYQRAGGAPSDLLESFPRRRLDAETIRDSILAASGSLDRTMGGPHPFPARKDWNFSKAAPFYAVYPSDRRSVYLMQQRLKRHPYLALFDGADPNASTEARFTSTTSIQALFMMNSPFVHDQAARFAARLRAEAPEDRTRIDLAHRIALGRPATGPEIAEGEAFLRRADWTAYAKVLLSSNEFVYVD
jgi:hypothetical protein